RSRAGCGPATWWWWAGRSGSARPPRSRRRWSSGGGRGRPARRGGRSWGGGMQHNGSGRDSAARRCGRITMLGAALAGGWYSTWTPGEDSLNRALGVKLTGGTRTVQAAIDDYRSARFLFLLVTTT